MRIDVLTLFPEVMLPFFGSSMIGRALERGIVELACATDAPESGEIVRLSSTKHRN